MSLGPPINLPPGRDGYGRFERFPDGWRPEPSQTMARWALGLSFVPCGLLTLVGAGLGIATLVRSSRDRRNYGRKKAIGAIVVGSLYVVAAVVAVAIGVASAPDRGDDGEIEATGDVSVADLREGDCLQDPITNGEQSTVTVTPCAEPHHAEIYAEFELGEEFPGETQARRLAAGGCSKRLPPRAGSVRGARGLEVYYLYPNSAANFRRDQTVSCIVVSKNPRTGSIVETA